jgi:hypothetical protein
MWHFFFSTSVHTIRHLTYGRRAREGSWREREREGDVYQPLFMLTEMAHTRPYAHHSSVVPITAGRTCCHVEGEACRRWKIADDAANVVCFLG